MPKPVAFRFGQLGKRKVHIIALIASIVGGLIFFVIRAGRVAQAGRELGDLAGDAMGAARRAKFRRGATKSPLSQISDPREAAVALMVAIAKTEGDLTSAQTEAVESLATERLGFDDGAEILAHARWLTHDLVDPGHVVHRVLPLLIRQCDDEQRRDIISMLTEVAKVDGEPAPIQLQIIQKLSYDFKTHKSG